MVARQQEKPHFGKSGHLLEGTNQQLSLHLVRFENVSAHNHELASLLDGQPSHFLDYVEPGGTEASLSFLAKKVPDHPYLPVCGMKKSDHANEDNTHSIIRTIVSFWFVLVSFYGLVLAASR